MGSKRDSLIITMQLHSKLAHKNINSEMCLSIFLCDEVDPVVSVLVLSIWPKNAREKEITKVELQILRQNS